MTFFDDLRYAFRTLRAAPVFSLVALLVLALGIGANTALFSLVHGVLLRPLPVPDSERLVMLTRSGDVSLPDVEDWRAESESIESFALFLLTWAFDYVPDDGDPLHLEGSVVEPEYFELVSMAPLLGRVITTHDNAVDGERVAVISERFWRRLGGGDDVIGTTIDLSGNATTVIGVMPAAFDIFETGVDLWVPAAVETPWAVGNRGTNNFDAIGKLAPGVPIETARVEMRRISEQLAEAYPKTNLGKVVDPMPLISFIAGPSEPVLWLLLAAVALVLLIASLNLASLLLARALERRRDIATRLALGAPRARLSRQAMMESLLLSVGGATHGILVALWARDLVLTLAPDLPRSADLGLDWRVLLFAIGIALLTAVLTGLLPTRWLMRASPARALAGGRGQTADRGQRRLLGGLVVAEVIAATVMLVGCGLVLRTFDQLHRVELGFDTENVLLVDLVLPEARYSEREAQSEAFRRIVAALETRPGIESVGSMIGKPLDPRGGIGGRFLVEGMTFPPGEEPGARRRPIHGATFDALRQPLLAGRAFGPDDRADTEPVAIVNQRFVDQVLGDAEPIGQRIALRSDEPRWLTIVGVVADIKGTALTAQDSVAVYTPYLQRQATWQRWGTVTLRTDGDPMALLPTVEEAVWSVDAALPLAAVETLAERHADALAGSRLQGILLSLFAVTALALAGLGIYGLLSFGVQTRKREIGVRMALGADRARLVRAIVGRGVRLVSLGLVVGLGIAWLAGHSVTTLLYGVGPRDPITYGVVIAILLSAALIGAWLPATRASRVDPIRVLRQD